MRRKKIQKTKGMSTKVGEERTSGTVLPAGDLTVGGDGSSGSRFDGNRGQIFRFFSYF